ncbi:MAG: MBL fold metallo-hydrolase, partial [Oscillospiraceae bacterium]
HLLGIAACTAFFTKGMSFRIYAVKHSGFSAKEQVLRLVSPPLWPITPNEFLADVSFYDIALPRFYIGHVCVDVMEGNHPGGCSIFKLSFNGKSIVFNTDYEYGTACDDELISFAKDCDLFLCDGQYSDEEISSKRGFGHSSWNEAAELGKKCNAGHTIIVHHAPKRTDDELREAENMIKSKFNNCTFAHAKEEIIL